MTRDTVKRASLALMLLLPLLIAADPAAPVLPPVVEELKLPAIPAVGDSSRVIPPPLPCSENKLAPALAVEFGPVGRTVSPRAPLESDHAFDRFIGPVSNPFLSRDPRSLTEARFLFINNQVDASNPIGIDTYQVYSIPCPQLRVALSDRMTLTLDKDGWAAMHPRGGSTRDGWLDLAAGLKFTFFRDVENQALAAAGLTFEPQTGSGRVFQAHGDGLFTLFTATGKEFNRNWHVLSTLAYQFPLHSGENSSFFYTSVHVDRRCFGRLYPMLELNWFYYLTGGSRLPREYGEGEDVFNLGTGGVGGQNLVTLAPGLKARLCEHAEVGTSWEFPLTHPHYLINNRLVVELILRY